MIAAVCPATGATAGIIMPQLNTLVINVFLKEFSAQLAADVHAVLIWDGAGYHINFEVEVPSDENCVRSIIHMSVIESKN